MTILPALPQPSRNWAMFLDIDGTLLDFAPTPDEVRAPPGLIHQLHRIRATLDGALAIVSGRSITSIDEVFVQSRFAAAGQHGVERRDAHGAASRSGVRLPALEAARERLDAMIADHTGLVLEDKGQSIALHYRLAPTLAAVAGAAMYSAWATAGREYIVVAGSCVLELRPRDVNKGTAIVAFMRESPFAGRRPVFIGDDRTDEDGFRAVDAMGGHAIKVGIGATRAGWRIASVSGVSEWLAHVADRLEHQHSPMEKRHERTAAQG
ncbi:MAG: trehalose-phosphatase [Gemmatimonadaceae bacterium]